MESKMDSSSPYHILISCVVFSCIRKLLTLLKPFNFLIYYGCTTAPVKKMNSLWGDAFLIHSLALTHIIFYCQRTLVRIQLPHSLGVQISAGVYRNIQNIRSHT